MPIRCTSKAIVLHDGKVLLNRCRDLNGDIYYDLPGGGQHLHETMEDALIREIQEETGYTVRILRFAGVAEEIYTAPLIQQQYPEYTHRILHLFAAELTDHSRTEETEKDLCMEDCVWMPLEEAEGQDINPFGVAGALRRILEAGETVYLGSRSIEEL